MTEYVGGIRERDIRESLIAMVEDSLLALGWVFEGTAKRDPITVLREQVPMDEEITRNTIALWWGDSTHDGAEVGSNETVDTYPVTIDIYGQDDSLASQLSGDIRSILQGQFPTVGRTRPNLDVYNTTADTPSLQFTCRLEGIERDRVPSSSNSPFRRNWFAINLHIVDDEYKTELT